MNDKDWQRKIRTAEWRVEDAVRARNLWVWTITLSALFLFSLAFLGAVIDPAWFIAFVPGVVVGVPYLGWSVTEAQPWYTVRRTKRNLTTMSEDYTYALMKREVTVE